MLVVPGKEARQIGEGCDSRLEPTFDTDHPPVGLDFGTCLGL
jgi:hypothetical protein